MYRRRRRNSLLKHKRNYYYNMNIKMKINRLPEKDVSLSMLTTYFTINEIIII